ncbi:hypothetical protein C2E23DRAFT_832038 [Lenzites betulinus]|nr:hypothetical protein C2E23DRAFT_832038 [Lenzites betulinus]
MRAWPSRIQIRISRSRARGGHGTSPPSLRRSAFPARAGSAHAPSIRSWTRAAPDPCVRSAVPPEPAGPSTTASGCCCSALHGAPALRARTVPSCPAPRSRSPIGASVVCAGRVAIQLSPNLIERRRLHRSYSHLPRAEPWL